MGILTVNFMAIVTFVANVTLLNLVVAIMTDTYEEVMSSIVAKERKSLNKMMLRYDKMRIWKKEVSIEK